MIVLDAQKNGWIELLKEAIDFQGVVIVENVLEPSIIETTKSELYQVQKEIIRDVGTERLKTAGELGVLRLMFRYSEFFFKYLEIPEVLQVVDATVSNTGILHLQNGFILPSFPVGESPSVFQNRYHMDFPRVLNGALLSINVFFPIDDFTSNNGGTLVSVATQQSTIRPSKEYLEMTARPVECSAGSMIVFDSTLWHAAGMNRSGKDRLAINMQFTRSYVKQQIDYVRAIGAEKIVSLPERTRQLLGWFTRVVTSLDEYYQPPEKRLYRAGQG